MNKSVLKAITVLYAEIPGSEDADILDDIKNDVLTDITARNGREALWYMVENIDKAIYVDTLEFLTEEEIEKELC